jgi:hypothetical protein
MWHGLEILTDTPATASPPRQFNPQAPHVAPDPQFVRLVANLVLRTHTELTHVY